MALTYTIKERKADRGYTTVDITLDGSYPANGYALDAASLGLLKGYPIMSVNASDSRSGTAAVVPMFDAGNQKLRVFETGGAINTPLAEVGAAEVNGVVVRATVHGEVAT